MKWINALLFVFVLFIYTVQAAPPQRIIIDKDKDTYSRVDDPNLSDTDKFEVYVESTPSFSVEPTGIKMPLLSDGALSLSSNIVSSGTLSVANGGTNSTTALNNNRAIVSSGGSIIESATITTTELGLLNGMTAVVAGTANSDKFASQGYVDDNIGAVTAFSGKSASVYSPLGDFIIAT